MKPRLDPRLAGQVRRWHTWPTIQKQTVAEHSWGVTRILLAIWPDAPREVITEALFHNTGEIATGDLPYPVKADNASLKNIIETMEGQARLEMCLPWAAPPPQHLVGWEALILKLCDTIEMWEFGIQETMLGNRFGKLVVDAMSHRIRNEIAKMNAEEGDINEWVVPIAEMASGYVMKRQKEWSVD